MRLAGKFNKNKKGLLLRTADLNVEFIRIT
jgi:hypothetical protein